MAISIEILIGGLRGLSVGTDTGQYISILKSITSYGIVDLETSDLSSRDSFFWLLYGSLFILFKGYSGLFLFHSAFNWLVFTISIKNISKHGCNWSISPPTKRWYVIFPSVTRYYGFNKLENQ